MRPLAKEASARRRAKRYTSRLLRALLRLYEGSIKAL
jgi:hypothetical protein